MVELGEETDNFSGVHVGHLLQRAWLLKGVSK